MSLVGSCSGDLQSTLDDMLVVASALGLRFNATKYSPLVITKGQSDPDTNLFIREVKVFSLAKGEYGD